MALSLFLVYLVFSLVVLYKSYDAMFWDIISIIYLFFATIFVGFSSVPGILVWSSVIGIIAIHRLPELRVFISNFIYNKVKNTLPRISQTEKSALNAGDTWFEESIFRGEPDLSMLQGIKPELTEDEQSFLDNEVNELCALLDEWSIEQNKDLSAEAWDYIKKKGFLGIVIPKEYGGKGFSALAHSEIVMKLASRSGTAAVSVMVPNSLGPAELLLNYGTDVQKQQYLPKLAIGEEIPCFALTEPEAGSDATSVSSKAVVVKRKVAGKEVLGLSINLEKRWITLAPIATLLGVAVKLSDPDGLLAGIGLEGITCVLIPHDAENLQIGNRHLPANTGLMNGTIRGNDIFVAVDNIIGGQKNAGLGWEMLVECLAIGRAISLPALSAAVSGVAYLSTGAFACVRQQFATEIGHFEGVQEKLAAIAGYNYLVNSTRLLTLAAVYAGKKPSTASAITKYFSTELAREVINNAMDIHGGRAVVAGPRNYLANHYCSMPIYITVEGANIMTRNLLIFGQGAIAAHPFLRAEIEAIDSEDQEKFHELIWQHINYFAKNFAKSVCSSFTGGWFLKAPNSSYRKLQRLAHNYAWLADLALLVFGGSLKRKERISARLADGMAYLYMAAAALHFAHDIEKNDDNYIHAQWAASFCFSKAQQAMLELCVNFPSRIFGKLIKFLVAPWGYSMRFADDKLDSSLAKLMMHNNEYRNLLLRTLYMSADSSEALARIENAYQLVTRHRDLYAKFGKFNRFSLLDIERQLQEYVQAGKLSTEELATIMDVERARRDAILVDEFSPGEIKSKSYKAYAHKF